MKAEEPERRQEGVKRDYQLRERYGRKGPMPPKLPTHHCPVCYKQASIRCANLGHYAKCPTHNNYYNPWTGCVQCQAQERREEAAARTAAHAGAAAGGNGSKKKGKKAKRAARKARKAKKGKGSFRAEKLAKK